MNQIPPEGASPDQNFQSELLRQLLSNDTKLDHLHSELQEIKVISERLIQRLTLLEEKVEIQASAPEVMAGQLESAAEENEILRAELAKQRDMDRRETLREVQSSDPQLKWINLVVLLLSLLAVIAALYMGFKWS